MPTTPASKATKPRKKRARAKCLLCNQRFVQLTPAHLRTHGYTFQRYRRVFGGNPVPMTMNRDDEIAALDEPDSVPEDTHPNESVDIETLNDPSKREMIIDNVAQRLAKKKAWLACIADEVGEKLVTGVLRHRLTASLVTTLAGRLAIQGQAQALLADVLGELREEWRVKQGGIGGKPTPTGELVHLAQALTRQLRDSEDLVLRSIKLALDEQRLAAEHTDALGPALYTGGTETIDVPMSIDGGEREAIRTLLGRLATAAKRVEATSVTTQVPSTKISKDVSKDSNHAGTTDAPAADTRSMSEETQQHSPSAQTHRKRRRRRQRDAARDAMSMDVNGS